MLPRSFASKLCLISTRLSSLQKVLLHQKWLRLWLGERTVIIIGDKQSLCIVLWWIFYYFIIWYEAENFKILACLICRSVIQFHTYLTCVCLCVGVATVIYTNLRRSEPNINSTSCLEIK